MNILIVNATFSGGGAEKVARQIYYGMTKYDDCNMHFIAGKGIKKNGISVIYNKQNVGLRIINKARNLLTNNARKRDILTTTAIIRYIKKYDIDIIHFHNIHGNYIGINDIKEISKYCKVIWTLHDMWSITGHCAYSMQCDKWKDEKCRKCANLLLYPRMWVDKAENRRSLKENAFTGSGITFVTPSSWLEKICRFSFLKSEKIFKINNGVDANCFKVLDKKKLRQKYCIPFEKIVLMFSVNQWDNPYKGVHILYDALEQIENKENYFLLLLGNKGKIQIEDGYECKNMGYIQGDDVMNELYSVADVFVMPSLAENFPCSILESLASGTPVIASTVGGIPEQIDGSTGWLFEAGNAHQLAGILVDISEQRNRLGEMCIKCRERIETCFTEEKMLREYRELYKRVIEE